MGADARLTASAALHIQEASLTGESEAVLKEVLTLDGPAALGDQRGMVFKGTAVAQGTGRAVVTATGMDTEMGAIARMLEATQEDPTPLQREIGRIGRMLGVAVVIIAAVVVGTVFLISDIRTPSDAVACCCSGSRWRLPPSPRVCRRSCPWSSRWVSRAWRSTGRSSSDCPRWRPWAPRPSSPRTRRAPSRKSEMTIQRIITASGGTHVTGVGYAPIGAVEHEDRPLQRGH